MNILILGPKRTSFHNYFDSLGYTIKYFEEKIDINTPILQSIDYIISYGYRYIIPSTVINKFKNKIINLHISYLPWNKGADPNLWSFLENTPKGVTIHNVDESLDTGDIIVQKEIQYTENDTLRTTYQKLTKSIETLLIEQWPNIISGKVNTIKQNPQDGSFHRSSDKNKYLYLLSNSWDTRVMDLLNKAKNKEVNYEKYCYRR